MAAVLLLALLAVVGTLQYRWLGDVSTAERERLEASLRSRGHEFAASLNGDLTRAFAAFHVDAGQLDANPTAALRAAADRAAATSATGRAVTAILVAEPGADRVQRFVPSTGTIDSIAWPAELAALGRRLAASPPLAVAGLPLPPELASVIDGEVPALIVPLSGPSLSMPSGTPGDLVVRTIPVPAPSRTLVVWLDRERVRDQVVAPLVVRHFGDGQASEFNVSVVSQNGQTLFRSGAEIDSKAADLAADVFALQLNELHWDRVAPGPAPNDASPGALKDRVAITVFRRGVSEGSSDTVFRARDGGAGWRLLVQARRGSLDAVVARSRLRNIVVSLGVLGVLGASLALILIASAREQRLARQQLEFVASVSHELRTPLAVIRSAGENLADGVVAQEQVAKYGALIRSEGRRLSDMVERVMDLAGMASGTVSLARKPTDVRTAIDATVAAIGPDAAERSVVIRVHAAHPLPPVLADRTALQSALQNVVGNAVKYSTQGGEVDIDAAATARLLRIAVSDRGIGIDREDLSRVFEPFFRGRRAVESQVRGSGVGLSVVQKIVDAHGGSVGIAARDGGGTVLTIELPVTSPAAGESAA